MAKIYTGILLWRFDVRTPTFGEHPLAPALCVCESHSTCVIEGMRIAHMHAMDSDQNSVLAAESNAVSLQRQHGTIVCGLRGSGHFPLEYFPGHFPSQTIPIFTRCRTFLLSCAPPPSACHNIKRSTVDVNKIDRGRSVRVRSAGSKIFLPRGSVRVRRTG